MNRKAAIAAAVMTAVCLLGGCVAETEENQTDDMEQTTDNAVQQEEPERPDIAGLRLTAELPEQGIAVYTEPQSGKSWLCSGGQLQEVTDSVTGEAELHYGDFNGDGTEELAVLSGMARDGRLTLLTIYQWNGQFWKGRRAPSPHFEVIDGVCDPNDCFQFYEDGTAYLMYEDKTMLLDLSSICQDWETEPTQCVLAGAPHYICQDGELFQTFTGYIEGHNDVPVFSRVSTFDYMWYWQYELSSPYEIKTEFDIEQLSGAQKEVLRQFISGCREVLAERKHPKDTLFEIRLALCDLDGDGNQELLLEAGNKDFADYYGLSVYRTDGQYLCSVPYGSRFYDNGLVWEPWSHNQGVNSAIWPFDLYRLQDHEYLGGARARHSQAPGEFPAEADLDGDGMVYLVGDFNDGDYVDNAVYDEWWASCVGDARLLPVCYFPLTEEIIDSLKEDTIG